MVDELGLVQMAKQPDHLDSENCLRKAAECLAMARVDKNASHRTMLEHMAEPWERIAKSYERKGLLFTDS